MAKDFIFDGTKRIKEKPHSCCPYIPHTPNFVNRPVIDMMKYVLLLPDTLLQEGDEFYIGGNWIESGAVHIGRKAGIVFPYRRRIFYNT